MKIEISKPSHWLYLLAFTVTICCAAVLRMLRIARANDTCLLYGHKLNGNLKALYDFNRKATTPSAEMFFLTMDYHYCRELRAAGHSVINGINPFNALKIARAFAIVSDHGLHTLSVLQRTCDIPFFDVWHAIPIKGFDENDFRTQQGYEKVFVTSELVRRTYLEKFGFKPEQVSAAGYARTDILIDKSPDLERIRANLGIEDGSRKIILFAPTWQQDDPTRDIFPFGASAADFFGSLEKVCVDSGALCIFRTHLNSGEINLAEYESILFRPHSHYPETEEILLLTDCLVSDWSSIVFDFMLLDRPTLFLDVPHPFQKGFSLGPENRFGKLVGSLQELCTSLEAYLEDPALYAREYGSLHATTKQNLYDGNADGMAARRVCTLLEQYRPGYAG